MKDDIGFCPQKGLLQLTKPIIVGYKLNMVFSSNSVIYNFSITQVNVHDVRTLDVMTKGFLENVKLLGGKGYIGKNIQLSLFKEYSVKLITPLCGNQIEATQRTPLYRKTRKRIRTTFSQFCCQFSI